MEVLVLFPVSKILTKRTGFYGLSGMDCPWLHFWAAAGFKVLAIQQEQRSIRLNMDRLIIHKKSELFTVAEVDYIVCALMKYVCELRSRTHLMERFASREHLQNHCAKILLGEKILNDFQ